MPEKLTKKQNEFVKEYLETGNGTQAALKAYDTDSPKVASVIASENLAKPSVREYLESKADKAAEVIYILATSAENEGVRLNASKDILDRSGYKPIEKTMNVNMDIDTSDPEAQKLAKEYEERIKKQDI